MVRVSTLNLNGIRSAWKKGAAEWLSATRPDLLCVQELKAQAADLADDMRCVAGLSGHFAYAQKKGYSGVGLYSRLPPNRVIDRLGVEEFDAEGRYVQADFDQLRVVSLYLPSGSSSEERQLAKFRFMEAFLAHLRVLIADPLPVLVCGDWNIAHRECDLKNWKSNQKNSGFLPEERAWFGRVLDELGWVDVYRNRYPDATGEGYTWWSNRGQAWANNVGWRIDYQLASPALAAAAREAQVYRGERFSDHAPLTVDYDIPRLTACGGQPQ